MVRNGGRVVYSFAMRNGAREFLGVIPAPITRRLGMRRERGKPTIPLSELDARIARARELLDQSADAGAQFLASFRVEPPAGRPEDPYSPAYADWVWDLYRAIAGRDGYTVAYEASTFDLEEARRRPYPYSTGSANIVGDQLIARGFILKALGLNAPARVVEFGSGWGGLTIDLALMGLDVTAVDVEPQFCSLVRDRYGQDRGLTVVQSEMLAFESDEPYDAAIFYESFHHCSDHLALLEKLHRLVRPGGVVVFAAEPISCYDYPWGPRLDGQSVFSTRMFGWLELGFDPAYFFEALARAGWSGNRLRSRALCGLTDVVVARSTR